MIREFFSVALANIALRFSGLLIIPLLANNFSKEQMGVYDIVWTAIIFFELFLGFKISDACYRYSLKSNDRKSYFYIAAIFIFIVSIVALLFLMAFSFFMLEEYLELIFIAGVIVVSKLFISLYLEYLRVAEEFASYSILGGGLSVGYLLNCFCQLYFYSDLTVESFYLGFLIVNLLLIFIVISFHLKNTCSLSGIWRGYYDPIKFREVVFYGVKLLPSGLAWWFLRYSQRWSVLFILGVDFVAIVTISSYPLLVFTVLTTYIYMAAQRSLFKWVDSSNGDDSSVVLQYRAIRYIYFLLSVSIFIFFDYSSYYLFPNSLFDRQATIVALLGGYFLSLGSYFGNVYSAQLRVGYASITSILSALLSFIATLIALCVVGVSGFSIGVLVGGVALFIMRCFDVPIRRIFYDLKIDVPYFILVIISFWAISSFQIIGQVIMFLLVFSYAFFVFGYDSSSRKIPRNIVKKFLIGASKWIG